MLTDEYMPLSEAKKKLKLSKTRVLQLTCERGGQTRERMLVGEFIGGRWFYKRDEVARFSAIEARPGNPNNLGGHGDESGASQGAKRQGSAVRGVPAERNGDPDRRKKRCRKK